MGATGDFATHDQRPCHSDDHSTRMHAVNDAASRPPRRAKASTAGGTRREDGEKKMHAKV